MTKLKSIFAVIVLLVSTSASFAQQAGLEYLKGIKDIDVFLGDGATDACWTNLTESREYAEEKVRMAGGNLYEAGTPKAHGEFYSLNLDVISSRANNGLCFGYIEVHLNTGTRLNGKFHLAKARFTHNIFTQAPNANSLVIDVVQTFFSGD
jgi:hypothetical protein